VQQKDFLFFYKQLSDIKIRFTLPHKIEQSRQN